MKTLLILLASAVVLSAADATTNPVRLGPRFRPNTNAVPAVAAKTNQPAAYGPIHNIESIPGVRITVVATNQFSMVQLRRWLQEAAKTVK